MKEYASLVKEVLIWYAEQRRTLPWRHTHVPYNILVSEVMLQQTQVERVKEKYISFLHQFPTLEALAVAPTSAVITAWSGLGYNRRALFLQKTAQAVTTNYGGTFPETLEELITLPGVGDYTARAILSFAFDTPVAVMDTNHRKFYSRIFQKNISDKDLLILAQSLIDDVVLSGGDDPTIATSTSKKDHKKSTVYHWNQALMDFMTAVVKNHHHMVVQQFIGTYPELPKKQKKQKKTIPFKQTDRYIRGRIVDALRGVPRQPREIIRNFFPEISEERFERVVVQLAKDGLIKLSRKSILLP